MRIKTTLVIATIMLFAQSAQAGFMDGFMQGAVRRIDEKNAIAAQRDNDEKIIAATSITHEDVDVLIAHYKECLDSLNLNLPSSQEAYFKKKFRDHRNNADEIAQIKDEYIHTRDAHYEQGQKFCSNQLEAQKQEVIQQKTARLMLGQQQAIIQQQRDIE